MRLGNICPTPSGLVGRVAIGRSNVHFIYFYFIFSSVFMLHMPRAGAGIRIGQTYHLRDVQTV